VSLVSWRFNKLWLVFGSRHLVRRTAGVVCRGRTSASLARLFSAAL